MFVRGRMTTDNNRAFRLDFSDAIKYNGINKNTPSFFGDLGAGLTAVHTKGKLWAILREDTFAEAETENGLN